MGGSTGDPYFSSVTALLHFNGSNGDTTTTDVKGNSVTRNGTPTLSTTQVKYGTTSSVFNGSQSWECAAGAGLQMGSGDFTLECWIYPTSIVAADFLNTFASSAGTSGFALQLNNASGAILFAIYAGAGSSSIVSSNGAVVANSWQHIAVSRNSSSNLYLYVNGVVVASSGGFGSVTMNTVAQSLNIGAEGTAGTSGGLTGYIDDVRVTKGVGRYPSGTTFTPPTAAYPDA